MKTALLHYWLTNLRGGEKVLLALREMFPAADVFTHAISAELRGRFPGKVTESFIASLPLGRRLPQGYLPLMPLANRRFRLDGYDLILSSESGPVKGIRKPKDARHVCYCHTPMRYVWDMYGDYYARAGFGGKLAMKVWTPYLRAADLKSAESVDAFVANSAFVAARIRRIYGRDATVVPPPVDVEFFSAAVPYDRPPPVAAPYYLLAGELVAYKRPDLALAACVKMNRPVVVVGRGGLCAELARTYAANPCVTFLGRVSDDALRAIYAHARALLFPGCEDFGIVPVEAQAAGTPVVAYGRGGARETVVEGETGLFFDEQTVDSLCGALEAFEARNWSAAACRANAANFSRARFFAGMRAVLGARYCSSSSGFSSSHFCAASTLS